MKQQILHEPPWQSSGISYHHRTDRADFPTVATIVADRTIAYIRYDNTQQLQTQACAVLSGSIKQLKR
jgi:hypothetical protein